jgi:arginine decarboxylase
VIKKGVMERWNKDDSSELYHIKSWGAGYFDISDSGNVVIRPFWQNEKISVDLMNVLSGIIDRGYDLPVLLRIENILHSQIRELNDSFRNAIKEYGYQGEYRAVYPIKVNQQQQVVEAITRYGAEYHHGLEAGSKAELIAALSFLDDPEACLVCNGYKDREFVDLGLYATRMGLKCFFVIETPGELDLILERSEALGIRPLIGARIKVSTQGGGHWMESGGDRSIFGLNVTQVLELVEKLKTCDMLDCFQLLHYHLGSQIPNIRDIRSAVLEACRVYAGLAKEGANMRYFDLGGGLAVDYDGSNTNYVTSRNYGLNEYCSDLIESIMSILDEEDVAHPTIITETGRAIVAYYSVLLFNVLDKRRFEGQPVPEKLPEGTHDIIQNLHETLKGLNLKNTQECYNDAIYYRDQVRQLFKLGEINLRERSLSENIFWHLIQKIAKNIRQLKFVPKELQDIPIALADTYYGNFSVFQSLPDAWAIEHLFPIMPIHRLNEMPDCLATVADITCDSDGKIDKFIDIHGVRKALPLHQLRPDEEYYLGVFLVGAYQETLGDLHNLFGDTNVVTIRVTEDGRYSLVRELEGDTVADVLSYVEYEPKSMMARFLKFAERAVGEHRITAPERRKIMKAYESGLRGYTYFER